MPVKTGKLNICFKCSFRLWYIFLLVGSWLPVCTR